MQRPKVDFEIKAADFVKSAVSAADCPSEGPPEVAFAGRSNVGKSSLINTLLGRKGLVRTSATPGCTRLLNFFHVEMVANPRQPTRRQLALSLVDLPGFGFAKVAKAERANWRRVIEGYLTSRRQLRVVVLVVDGRRGAELDERELAPWLARQGIAVIPVMTKADKLPKHERPPCALVVARNLGASPVVFSAVTGEGRDELWQQLLVHILKDRTAHTS